MRHTPIISRPHPSFPSSGTQDVYRFENGYGASVVKFSGSYGFERGLFELAVVKFKSPDVDGYSITYETPITDDVIGYLTPEDVSVHLDSISKLPASVDA